MTKSVSRSTDFRPRKRLGQIFIRSEKVRDRLVRALDPTPRDTVLEIGAGGGFLTRQLARSVGRVFAVEFDGRLIPTLETARDEFSNISIINEDILKVDLSAFGPLKIFGNIPYSLSTPILFRLLRYRDSWTSAVLTLQKEFARRLCGRPGTRAYGSITVVFDLFTRRKLLFLLPPSLFSPRPRVSSALVRIDRVDAPRLPGNEDFFFRVVRASFGQRRKTLANNLGRGFGLAKPDLAGIQTATGIDLGRRAETLSVEEFCAISDAIDRGPAR